MAAVLHSVEEYSVRIYFIYPDVGFSSTVSISYFLETNTRNQKLFQCAAIEFLYPIMLVGVLDGCAHQFPQTLFLPVASYTYGLGLVVSELS